MSRKDFEALAYALGVTGASRETIKAVGDACYASNGRFDRGRFELRVTEWRRKSR